MSTISGDFGELTINTEMIDVTSTLPRMDRNWRYTDTAGHEHHWAAGREPYPTLVEVVDDTYSDWCYDCEDEHEHVDAHLECPLCGETIQPGMVAGGMVREYAAGRTEYLLNGEPITEERAREIYDRIRSDEGSA